MRQRNSHRWLAIFFIAFALADCWFSDYCCEEKRIGSLSGARGATNINIDSSDSTNEQPADSAPIEEECFCCCTHILPGIHFEAVSLEARLPENDLTNPHLPSPPPQNAFHPPRFS